MRHPPERVVLRNVRQHNLKGITVEFPRRALSVVTGPSGSGKSSLAFDTLYAEGQRRYIESLSTYAKQFLERMPKPLVDSMEGLSPAVAIEQKNPTTSSRSTVGTATEIADFLRLLWARAGTQSCLQCGHAVKRDTVQEVVDAVMGGNGKRETENVMVAFPLPQSAHRPDVEIAAQLRAAGFVRAQVDGDVVRLDAEGAEGRVRTGTDVLVLVDRIAPTAENRGRLADAIATAFSEGEGVAMALNNGDRRRFSEHPACSSCGCPAPLLTPTLFSFNNPRGACPTCNGFGAVLEYDESLIVPDPGRSLAGGALDPWTKPRYEGRRRLLRETARARRIDFDASWREIPARERHFLLHNEGGRYLGIFPFLARLEEKRYKQYIRVFLRQYQLAKTCPRCNGSRLKPESLAVRVAGKTIAEAAALTAAELAAWLNQLQLPSFQQTIADHILGELGARVGFVNDVGLGYLTLDRQTRTLSGGEAQRIALSNALGSHLVDTLYVLDEPSIGLHPADVDRLLGLLRRLAGAGNTVVVVEHDPAAMRAADWMVELGPASGAAGGQLVYQGPAAAVCEAGTLTGQYLSGEKRIGVPSARRPAVRWLEIKGARLHNLAGVDVRIPFGTFTAVTGVSGSGKSTLVHDVLYRQLEARLKGEHTAKRHLGEPVGVIKELKGWEALEDVICIDQAPIGRTPRSNPVTYVKAFDELRALFANEALARARGYAPSTFSFNVAGGRCEACEGAGHVIIEMVFLANVFVPCEMCGGTRFKREVLDVKLQGGGVNIAQVLDWTVDQAIQKLHRHPRLARCLWYLQQVGLGYLRLGQSATTLSGGEAQRLKIARELAQAGGSKRSGKRKLYILDEPTTGLHLDDVRVLCRVLDRLVDAGHTVVVIEHNLDVIKRADWVIDLGPGAGDQGGRVVAAGTPEDVAAVTNSATGRYLRELTPAAAV
ncbi:MAG TPA: excinuclease ABC subunit UvrA [Gemmatimonadales bacterium]|nr:excinuclease ABC subunit UvrA [Gemmatimonadales bacterium]